MKLSEMKRVLSEGSIQLTKSLGQNFLHDSNQLARIVAAAELGPADRVLEIGPGLGPLTERLLERAGEVLAIEKDARLVDVLKTRFANSPKLRLLHLDALEYLRNEKRDWTDWKLVANLPYSVASPILVELAMAQRGPLRMVATLQLEVARRITANPGQEDYGVLTLLIGLDYTAEGLFKIPASCFFPEPEIDSGCVTLVRRPGPLLDAAARDTFVKVVKVSFGQRRKMLVKLLKTHWPAALVAETLRRLAIPPSVRAEELALEQFVGLARALV